MKTLQATARTAQRRASATSQHQLQVNADHPPQHGSFSDRGISDHNSDSGIGLEASDAEIEVGRTKSPGHSKSSSWHAYSTSQHQQEQQSLGGVSMEQHVRSKSVPQPLPLYQPPPPIRNGTTLHSQQRRRTVDEREEMLGNPRMFNSGSRPPMSFERYSPESNGRGGYSIQSVLSPAEPQHA